MAENNTHDSDRDGDDPSIHLPQQQQQQQQQEATPLIVQQEPSLQSEATITNAPFSETRLTDRRLTNSDDMLQECAETTIQHQQASASAHGHQQAASLTTTTDRISTSSANVEVMDGAHSSSFGTGSAAAATATTTAEVSLASSPSEQPITSTTSINPAAVASSSVEGIADIHIGSTTSQEIQPAPPLPEASGATESEGNHHERMAVVSATMTSIAITPAPEALLIEQDRSTDNSGVVADRMNSSGHSNGPTNAMLKLIVLPRVTVSATASNLPVPAAETGGEAVNNSNKSSRNNNTTTKKKRTPPPFQPGQASGRWTHAEHEAFIEGLKIFGREWKKVAVRIPTRTSAQVRSHAQKYFSKLSRDEQLMEPPSPAAAPAAHPSCGETQHSPQAAAAAETQVAATAASQAYPPSLQRNVERILANPEQAQRDVEDTLQALRARYHQLQQRLQEHRASNNDAANSSSAAHVEEEKETGQQHRESSMDEESESSQQQGGMLPQLSSSQQEQQRVKRRRPQQNSDDCSMASSTLSALGNEELIALSVLGATLPNIGSPSHNSSSSNNNNDHSAAPADEAAGHPSGNRNAQSNSSLESHSSSSSTSSANSAKRKRDEAA